MDGIHNLRDYGRYESAYGGKVRSGLLFRSGQHVGASDSDLAAIDALGLRTVIDLRGNHERASHPCRRGPLFAADVIFHDGETSNLPPHMDVDANTSSAQYAHKRMIATYARMPHNPPMLDIFSRYLRAVAEREGASLVHCFAGKDRTGMAVSLLLHILGVSRADQLAEFLLTNQASTFHILAKQALPGLEARLGRTLDEDAARALLEVHPDYFGTFIDEVEREYGSLDAYITEQLGVDEGLRQALRAKLIA